MKKYFLTLVVAMAFGATNSHADFFSLSGVLDPLQAGTNGGFGGGTGNGNGTISGQYDSTANLLDYTITFAELTSAVTTMHFHNGAPGVSGGVDLAIPGPYGSGVSKR